MFLDLIGEHGRFEEIGWLNFKCICNVVKNFQRKRANDSRRFDRAEKRPADICFLRKLLLGEPSHFTKCGNHDPKLNEAISVFKITLLTHFTTPCPNIIP